MHTSIISTLISLSKQYSHDRDWLKAINTSLTIADLSPLLLPSTLQGRQWQALDQELASRGFTRIKLLQKLKTF